MAFIMFIGVLFSSLVGKIVSFICQHLTELSYQSIAKGAKIMKAKNLLIYFLSLVMILSALTPLGPRKRVRGR